MKLLNVAGGFCFGILLGLLTFFGYLVWSAKNEQ